MLTNLVIVGLSLLVIGLRVKSNKFGDVLFGVDR